MNIIIHFAFNFHEEQNKNCSLLGETKYKNQTGMDGLNIRYQVI